MPHYSTFYAHQSRAHRGVQALNPGDVVLNHLVLARFSEATLFGSGVETKDVSPPYITAPSKE
jgi:hypothetical protein